MAGIIQSLGFQNESTIPREWLPYSTYFTSMVLCVYDNILGPTILRIWTGKPSSETKCSDPSIDQLLLISSYVIKDEACREEKIIEIETKFYALEKFDMIACSYIFRAPLRGGRMALFSFYVTLPYSELNQFMPRYCLCEDKVRYILKRQIIAKMEDKKSERPVKGGLISDQVEEFMAEFTHKLHGLCQVMSSVRYESLPTHIPVESTFFGIDSMDNIKMREFISDAVTCHLQIGGHTVVFGENREMIIKMLHTLALFLTSKERMMSRTVPSSKGEGKRYIPNLYLQGYTKKANGGLPFILDCLWKSNFPSAIIDMDRTKIYTNETTVPVYLRRKEETGSAAGSEKYAKILDDLLPFEKGKDSQIIRDYVRQMTLLPLSSGARDLFNTQFMRLLSMKAIASCKYIEAELLHSSHTTDTSAWPLNSLKTHENVPKVNKEVLMKELGLGESQMDLFIILCFTEKIRPRSYRDVLGDPQKDIEHILIDLEFV